MSIVKLLSIISLLIFSSCAVTSSQSSSPFETEKVKINKCHIKRAALDIGSGTSKLVVAVINKCNETVHNILFEAHRAIPFKEHLQRNKSGKFSKAFITDSINKLAELRSMAYRQGAHKIRAVATSAFRTAKNAKESASRISKALGFPIKIITQTDEALIAFHAALAKARSLEIPMANKIAVWDIGGGSMQIIKRSSDNEKAIYLGKLASVTFKNRVIKEINKSKSNSPNPLGQKRAISAMTMARKYANKSARPIIDTLRGYQVFGVGGVHYYSVKNQINIHSNFFGRSNILDTLLLRSNYNDQKLDSRYANTEVTNLALVLGFMQSLSIDKIYPLKINMAHGVLTDESMWK